MKKTFPYLIFLAVLPPVRMAAQAPAKPDYQAMMAKARQMADSIMKATKKNMSNNPGTTTTMPNMGGFGASMKPDTASYKPPPKNTALLGSVPQQKQTAEQLKSFINGIDKKLTAILVSEGVTIPNMDQYDAGTLCQSAIISLVEDVNGGEETALLALKAIEKAPGNVVLLNDCGAILNGCGFQPVAIPVLQTALDKSPNNSSIQNNLGQSYVALGDVEKATQYLQQCLIKSPQHPHANFSMACICNGRGDASSALKYVENSLRGSFSDGAWHLLFKLKKDPRLMDYLKDRYQQPAYFDEDKYHLPLQCEKVGDIPIKRAEFIAYHQMVESAKRRLNQQADQEFALGKQEMMDKVKNFQQNRDMVSAPFNELGSAMLLDIGKRMTDDGGPEIAKKQHLYQYQIDSLMKEYKKKEAKLDNCQASASLANDYMEKMSFVTTEYQKAYLRVYNDYYTDNIFWGSFATSDEHIKKGFFYRYAGSLLAVYLQLAETHLLEPSGCGPVKEQTKDTAELQTPEPNCPIDIDWKCVIGSFHLDCQKIKFNTKAGLLLNVDHSFKNHRTTIMIGAGLDLAFGKRSVGNIEGEFGAAGAMKYFITFDGTRPMDQGLIWKTSVSYKQEITNDYGFKNITTTDMDYGATTTLSVANGWTFEGQLYKDLDKLMGTKPEKQENKNVKVYK
ncbi:MAG TPA: tetratricopeptide repeat protein [Puia sp.]|nr:tetratricopeptide repeat protein [Puia sp.]